MKMFNDTKNKRLLLILLAAVFCLVPGIVGAECDCTKDTGIPPFLAEGTTPNLLLMIDNSASMYDLAYIDTADGVSGTDDDGDGSVDEDADDDGIDDDGDGLVDEEGQSSFCFDNTFSTTTTHVGYFDTDSWYHYDTATGWFEVIDSGECVAELGGNVYDSNDVCIETQNSGTEILSLKASGNFLNWASTSKYDVEKYTLTGGRYYDASDPNPNYSALAGHLESEGRGCASQRYIKQISLSDGAGGIFYLTLGVGTDEDLYDDINTSLISIFAVTENPFDPSSCQAAIDEMQEASPNFGTIQTNAKNCIMSAAAGTASHEKQALVESLHDCWYLDKFNDWPTGGAQGFNFEKWCEEQYVDPDTAEYTDPREIGKDDPAYICYGDTTTGDGYIGRCWSSGDGAAGCTQRTCTYGTYVDGVTGLENEICGEDGLVYYCTDWNSSAGKCQPSGTWDIRIDCEVDGTEAGWIYDTGTNELENCITEAREAFCGYITVPQVVDPSDLQTTTGETWNIPAILISQGASGQLGDPVATYNAIVQKDTAPAGLLQEFSDEIRIGAMAFNHDGAGSEFDALDSFIFYDHGIDGARVIASIGSDGEAAGHTDDLVSAINGTPATTWTPLAEAMYTAIGYYAQDTGLRINTAGDTYTLDDGTVVVVGGDDFSTDTAPITEYCQSNNVLFITDGSSTADLNSSMTTLAQQVTTMDPAENDGDDANDCGDLYGSSYFDDMTYYARRGDIYSGSPYAFEESPGVDADPENINTWIVYTGDTGDTGDECDAYTLMQNAVTNGGPNAVTSPGTDEVYLGGDATNLSLALRDAFENIIKRAAAGSAASVISATRSGEGAVYQAIFWPAKTGPEVDGEQLPDVTWTGEVHALLMDSDGNLYEDTDSDHALDLNNDAHVVFYFSEDADETVACYGELDVDGDCTGTVKSLDEVKYLWSVAEWLSNITDANITVNRANYISNIQRRYIYTWNDLNNDGVAASNEMIAFQDDIDWNGLDVSGSATSRGVVPYDFGVDPDSVADANAEVDGIVNWVRGQDATGYRTRTLATPANFDIGSDTITWRLGDVIYSTPTSVARPEENYHLVYRDDTYVDFVSKYKNRRHMVYFGANDGMIHAVNGGFYDATTNKFWKVFEDTDDDGVFEFTDSANAPALGAEMWAYVPYNLLPQLKCLRETSYNSNHKYFVDLKPRIFDVQIFNDDDDHPNGWGTIMVSGMRFGGGSVDADAAGDTRKFVSAYMIFDVTNPEAPPELLGELTYEEGTSAHMGYTTMVPVVAPMKETVDDVVETKWYLILGSGPLVLDGSDNWEYNTAMGGVSNQAGKIAVIPLDTLVSGDPFRIPTTTPDDSTAGIIPLMDDQGTEDVADDTAVVGFVSDPISVDFDLSNDYRADAVYFGTVEGDWTGWAGRLYRLVTNADSGISDPSTWELKEMLNPGRPVTAAPMAGWDGQNFWIYFGTGRFFDEDDKSNASSNEQESYYGLKEPVSCDDGYTFEWPKLSIDAFQQVGSIRVSESTDVTTAMLSCYDFDPVTETYSEDATGACIPDGVTNFSELDTYIAGVGCVENESTGVLEHTGMDGWAHAFDLSGERNLGQSTLLGGLLTFATYQPFDDLCRLEGEAYLYGLYFRTGTAWHESVFDDGGTDPVEYKKDLGRGLATTPNLHVGKEEGGTAYAQTSTGAIVEIEQPNMPIDAVKTGRMYWRSD